jgi:serine O-acetyltransferase
LLHAATVDPIAASRPRPQSVFADQDLRRGAFLTDGLSWIQRFRDHLAGNRDTPDRQEVWARVYAAQPGMRDAIRADALMTAKNRGDRFDYVSRFGLAFLVVRLCLVTDAFFAQCCYRAKVALQRRRVPFLPRIFHSAAVIAGNINIGDPVVIAPGVFIPHGQVVLDGLTTIGTRVTLSPFVSIGLRTGEVVGPTICDGAAIGTGTRILGPWRIGNGSTIGANAVVTSNVPDGATAVGIPARELH